MTAAELLSLLQEPVTRENVKRLLDLPTEPVAVALRELRSDVQGLAVSVQELAAAQARTDRSVQELAAAQARTDTSLEKLAAAQARTDTSLEKLAAAQARTDKSLEALAAEVKELAAAQARTEASMRGLRQDVGALADNVGFGLEELAAIVLPAWLEREEGVTVRNFTRRFFTTAEGEEEVDVYAEGERAGTVVPVVGEVKSRIYSGDVRRYAVKLARIAPALPARPLGLMFGFVVHPAANDVARELGLRLVASRPSV